MPIALYMDHHVPRAITIGLRLRGVDVVTAYEDDASDLDDEDLLDRATALARTLFTRDHDFLVVAARRQREGIPFYGVIFAHQLRVSIGRCIRDMETIARVGEPEDLLNGIVFLPL